METRKNFKWTSIVVLILAFATILKLAASFIGDFGSVEGVSAEALRATQIFIMVVSFIMLLPQIYIGVKGLLIAKNPDTSRAHIIWAIILLVFSVIGLVNPVMSIINKEAVGENVYSLLTLIIQISVYIGYIRYGKAIQKEAEQQ